MIKSEIEIASSVEEVKRARLEYIVNVHPFAFERLCDELMEMDYIAIKVSDGLQRHGHYLAFPLEPRYYN